MPAPVSDNPSLRRFELNLEGGVAFADYEREASRLVLTHVETPPALRGQGAASQLMQGIVELIADQNIKVIPVCSYAAAWFDKHPHYQHLLE